MVTLVVLGEDVNSLCEKKKTMPDRCIVHVTRKTNVQFTCSTHKGLNIHVDISVHQCELNITDKLY